MPASAKSSSSFSITSTVTVNGTPTLIQNVQVSNGKYGIAKLDKGNNVITFAHPNYKTHTEKGNCNGGTLMLNVQMLKLISFIKNPIY